MKTFFCLRKEHIPPEEWSQAWDEGKLTSLEEKGKCVTIHSWIYQTWSLLKKSGIPCHLIHAIPPSDVAIFLRLSLYPQEQSFTNPNLFLVDIVADKRPHANAHFHLEHFK